MATSSGSNGRQGQAGGGDDGAAAIHFGLLGLAAASVPITMAVSEPPPWLDVDGTNAYFVALPALAFFAGMTQVQASVVWAAGGDRCHVAGRKKKLMHAIVAAGLTAASLLL